MPQRLKINVFGAIFQWRGPESESHDYDDVRKFDFFFFSFFFKLLQLEKISPFTTNIKSIRI